MGKLEVIVFLLTIAVGIYIGWRLWKQKKISEQRFNYRCKKCKAKVENSWVKCKKCKSVLAAVGVSKIKRKKRKRRKSVKWYTAPRVPSWTEKVFMSQSGPEDYYLSDDVREIIIKYPKGTKYKIIKKKGSYLVIPKNPIRKKRKK